MKKDDFGDRMKSLEKAFTSQLIEPPAFLCVRIDGKGFSKFTKGFAKPFDDGLSEAMILTTERLVKETHASVGYTQSDEITLLYKPNVNGHEFLFGGKTSKLNSVLASMTAANFNYFIGKTAPTQYADKGLAYFDCRSWAAPSDIEASNVLLWRTQDARKNSISSLCRWTAGHKAMESLNQEQMKELLLDTHGVSWEELPNKYKYGTYVKSVVYETYLSQDIVGKIPKHKLQDSSLLVKRSRIERIDIGYFGDLSLNERITFIL